MSGESVQIDYPTSYTFKVMGLRTDDFPEHVRGLVNSALNGTLEEYAWTELPSQHGKYVSVSITVRLTSEEQRRAIYHAFHADERVVYYL